MGEHNEFGKLGEDLAADFLLKNGYEILERNYRYLKAEIDIIAKKDQQLAIVEVKSRSSTVLQDIGSTVTKKKITLLVAAADHFVTSRELDVEVRFDIITILKKQKGYQLEHLEDAYYYF